MTEQEQRIAIAEWSGWKDCFLSPGIGVTGNRPSPMDVYSRGLIPDFLHDLNAIHEAEKKLSKGRDQQLKYVNILCNVITGVADGPWIDEFVWNVCHAAAAQRAESLLKTIGKWKE